MSVNNIYEQEQNKAFDEIFHHSGAVYRGTPFWAWNNRLDSAQLCRQNDIFKKMGLGGFHMHPRTGLGAAYLSDEFMYGSGQSLHGKKLVMRRCWPGYTMKTIGRRVQPAD